MLEKAANHVVNADRYFSVIDDGLSQPWKAATVWCNPPYDDPAKWTAKALEEHREGRAGAVIMLLPDSTDTGWFQAMIAAGAVVMFSRRRLEFWRADERRTSAVRSGHVLFYLGPDAAKFKTAFASLFYEVGA